jgi:hypothetical protein
MWSSYTDFLNLIYVDCVVSVISHRNMTFILFIFTINSDIL